MANEDTASTEDSALGDSHENEWSIPQNADQGALWPSTISEKPGVARGNRAKARFNIMFVVGEASFS